MKIFNRALFGVSALALLLAATPVLANEVDVDAENNTTGADSRNENEFKVENEGDVRLYNNGDVDNKAHAHVDTGDNKQEKNTESGDIETGMVDASTDWDSVLNSGAALMGAGDSELDVSGDFLNELTGAYSKNENELKVENNGDLKLSNYADIFNDLDLWADTGDNSQYKNTTAGDISTGDVGVDSEITNEANNDSGFAGAGASSLSVSVSGENNTTGADSRNENEFKIENNGDTRIKNKADIDNYINVKADTGDNSQYKNTTAGDIETGSVEVSTHITNEANNGSGLAGASGHDLDVTGDFTNHKTGADSKNENELKVENNGDLTVNNKAEVTNKLDVHADTGDNKQEKNTTAGDISTGGVTIDFSSSTEVNSN